ncbi:protein phosphatase 2C domain-containing protein [Cyanobacterium aponinum]|uniref:protein phosphatase 2C domain-containing protein n=1 Tax=Cyanobacterium aponinum TaxID=379064 RepID=UPI000C12BB76|nr:protein phosphatase 2C domain-containing protein [Cyanobacterium aponinum]PHV63839.1 protein phosphatase [Cyanobacterium aponinum IPPAS B-1201]
MSSRNRINYETFGTSVIGPFHQQKNRLNEDAWGRINNNSGVGIVVSDGMGSKSNARMGAKMAYLAVKQSLLAWVKAPSASPSLLLRLIHIHWELNILPALKEDSVATCLFAVVIPNGQLIMAQLGDGIAILRENNGQLIILSEKNKTFGNQTTGLGVAKSTQEWSFFTVPNFPPNSAVLLATDGIADDLKSDTLGDFVQFILDDFGTLAPQKRWRSLTKELKNWPTPKHLDDKTLAVLWHRPK